jgi:hypothetical protein
MTDLFDGVIDLVADGLKNLFLVGEILVDAGIEFITDLPDYGGQLLGAAEEGGKVIINAVDPRHWFVMNKPLSDPEVIHAYASPKVVNSFVHGNVKYGSVAGSTLYLVSNAYNINLMDNTGNPLTDFAPLRLKAAINSQMLTDLKFGPNEKPLAKIYFYNTADMSWALVSPDLETDQDTVGADISRSGTYAVGIEIFPSHDKTAPVILDHFPVEGGTIQPDTRIWAKLFEENTGVGIDFGNTGIFIDGTEMDATWDPVNSVIAWKPGAPLATGSHRYTVRATDYQGNSTQLTVNFMVSTSGIDIIDQSVAGELFVFPNPSISSLNIEFASTNVVRCDLAIYNSAGVRIAGLYSGDLNQGVNRYVWNRLTDQGQRAGAGVYFVRMRLNDRALVKKIIVQ